jgi:hypothetical protein
MVSTLNFDFSLDITSAGCASTGAAKKTAGKTESNEAAIDFGKTALRKRNPQLTAPVPRMPVSRGELNGGSGKHNEAQRSRGSVRNREKDRADRQHESSRNRDLDTSRIPAQLSQKKLRRAQFWHRRKILHIGLRRIVTPACCQHTRNRVRLLSGS